MTQIWYDDCDDGYPWWRITGETYRKYFAIPPGGAVEELADVIALDLVCVGIQAIADRLGMSGRAVQQHARKLGYRPIGTTGRWRAPKEAA